MTNSRIPTLLDLASIALDHFQQVAEPVAGEATRRKGLLLDQSGEVIDTAGARAAEILAELGKGLISYAKKNPLAAVLFAVGAGVLLVSAANSASKRQR